MASKEAEKYCSELVCRHCTTCDGYGCEEFCDKWNFAIQSFNAGVASVPNDDELVDEIQVLRERINELENQLGQLKI